MIFEQYPYELFVYQAQESTVNDDGFAVAGDSEFVYHSQCRESSNGKPSIVSTLGGEKTEYSTVFVMPLGTAEIPVNTKIEIRNNGQKIMEANVIRFSEKQLHCRLWV